MNSQVTISGAPSYDNVFLVDGVVVNENLRGQPHNLFIEDAVQETTVLAGGVSAEYGRFTGGVVSTLTKSGGNRFSGSFRDSFTNPEWTEKTPWPTEADHVDKVDQIYEATLGGRILKDRLWFFGAGRLAERSQQRFTVVTNLPYTNGFDETRWEGKLTAQIARGHNLVASYLDIKNDETNNFFGNILDLDSLVPIRSLPNSLFALNYTGVITRNLMIEGQYANKKFAFENSGGRFTDRINGTLLVDTNLRRFHSPTFCGVCSFEERNNDSWLGKGTYYLDTPNLGSHSIILGVENFAEERIANNHQEGSDFRVSSVTSIIDGTTVYPRFGSAAVIQYQPILSNSEGTDFQTLSVFVNDKWDLNRNWSFNVGLRFDKNDGKDADGHTVSDAAAFSPRLGLAWDVTGKGRGRVDRHVRALRREDRGRQRGRRRPGGRKPGEHHLVIRRTGDQPGLVVRAREYGRLPLIRRCPRAALRLVRLGGRDQLHELELHFGPGVLRRVSELSQVPLRGRDHARLRLADRPECLREGGSRRARLEQLLRSTHRPVDPGGHRSLRKRGGRGVHRK